MSQPVRFMSEKQLREEIKELELLLNNGEMTPEDAQRLTELKMGLRSIVNHHKPSFP